MIFKMFDAKKEKIEKQDKVEMRSLWKACFHDSKEYMDYYFKYKLKDNQILALFEQGQAIAMIHLNPFRIAMNHNPIRAHYIVGVATEEQHRKKGLMRRLLIESMEKMYQDEVPFTYLMPASDKIYTPYGFRYIYAQERIHIKISKDASGKDATAEGNRNQPPAVPMQQEENQPLEVRMLQEENREAVLNYVNHKLKSTMQLYTIRTVTYYKRLHEEMLASGGNIFVVMIGQKVVGVIPFMLEKEVAEVVECVIESELTKEIIAQLIWQFFDYKEGKVQSKVEELEIHFLESFFLDHSQIVQEYPSVTFLTKPIIMARMIKVEECFRHVTFKEKDVFVLQVKDDILIENNQNFLLVGSKQGCIITKTSNKADLIITIEDLTSLLFGYRSVKELMQQKEMKVQGDRKRQLANINVLSKIYINEIA